MKAKDFKNSPILVAQMECKKAIEAVGDYILPVYEKAVEDGIIDDFEIEIEIWNNGYKLTINPSVNFKNAKSLNIAYAKFTAYVQPCAWFEKAFEAGYGTLEGAISIGWQTKSFTQLMDEEIKIDVEEIKQLIEEFKDEFQK